VPGAAVGLAARCEPAAISALTWAPMPNLTLNGDALTRAL